ncbi:hypothetical protein EVAR_44512_1 [Eumeta japonica]|uniref:Transposon Ty3-I Gag-Pol polyprotein n=1 Tax=Eumeta variegata TaxID=151549 RepID=A0A4C1YEJ3_EUMVA|nr:hypothetical protein EVAR_44512_1 [Eumeta japonica]
MEQGLCKPSKSPWSSPLHVVPKKNGDIKVCENYRRLNAITTNDRYPVLRTFQRYIYQVLIGLDFVFPFIDDVLIVSESKKQHLEHLRRDLGRFEKREITTKPPKSNLGQP